MKYSLVALVTFILTSLFWGIFPYFESIDGKKQLVITEDANLLSNGKIIGKLPKGTILHKPEFPDTAYTEPFDPQTYKIYIEYGQDITKEVRETNLNRDQLKQKFYVAREDESKNKY